MTDRLVVPFPGPGSRTWRGPRLPAAVAGLSARWSGWGGPLLVALFAGLLRFRHLGSPRAVVFDETYYAKDAWGLLNQGFVDNILKAVDIVADANDAPFNFAVSQPINNRDGHIHGFEIAGQHFFGDTGFGLAASYTKVDGNVKVYRGATLLASNARVGGNVQAENAKRVAVATSRVGGSIQLKQGGSIELTRNTVGSDIQLFSNRGRSVVSRNSVDGNLQCKSNRPSPAGGGNRVQGNKEDQCARL